MDVLKTKIQTTSGQGALMDNYNSGHVCPYCGCRNMLINNHYYHMEYWCEDNPDSKINKESKKEESSMKTLSQLLNESNPKDLEPNIGASDE